MIFDIGMHHAEDTAFFLKKGHQVIAVDADQSMINKAAQRFSEEIKNKQLVLIHKAIHDSNDDAFFHLSNKSEWNSMHMQIADRQGLHRKTIKVAGTTLPSLLQDYGVPLYCKIDIEGNDLLALQTLEQVADRPQYISVETECLGDDKRVADEVALATLDMLYQLGYSRFKLVEQNTLHVFSAQEDFYNQAGFYHLKRKLQRKFAPSQRTYLSQKFQHDFPVGATGPFAEELAGKWYTYSQASNMLLRHRKACFSSANKLGYGFWCDWHAK